MYVRVEFRVVAGVSSSINPFASVRAGAACAFAQRTRALPPRPPFKYCVVTNRRLFKGRSLARARPTERLKLSARVNDPLKHYDNDNNPHLIKHSSRPRSSRTRDPVYNTLLVHTRTQDAARSCARSRSRSRQAAGAATAPPARARAVAMLLLHETVTLEFLTRLRLSRTAASSWQRKTRAWAYNCYSSEFYTRLLGMTRGRHNSPSSSSQ